MGIVPTIVEKDRLLLTDFRSTQDSSIQTMFSPASNQLAGYVAQVHVVPASGGHLPDLIAVSALFQTSRTPYWDWVGWYVFLVWYIWVSILLMLLLSLSAYFAYNELDGQSSFTTGGIGKFTVQNLRADALIP